MIPAAPKLRFPEFKDPWKPGHAGDAFRNSRAKGAAGLPIYSVTMDRGLVRRDSLDRHMAADAADAAIPVVAEAYRERTGLTPALYRTRAAAGASVTLI